MKRKFSTREKVLLLILAILLLVCLYVFVVAQPVQTTVSDAVIRTENAKSEQTIGTAKLARMRKMEKALEERSADSGAIVPDYDNARNVVSLLNEGFSMADTYDLNFHAIEFRGQIACRNIDMNYTCGSYEAAKRILSVLYDGPYRCEITSVSMTDKDKLEKGEAASISSGTVSVKATVCFYEFAPEAAAEAENAKKTEKR